MSYEIPTPQEIEKRLIAEATSAQGTQNAALSGTAENMIVRILTIASYEIYRFILYLSKQILPKGSASDYLARHASFWMGNGHKSSSKAVGEVNVIGTEGITIPAETIATRSDGYLYQFDSDTTIGAGGTATGNITAQKTGIVTNTTGGIVLNLSAPIIGVESITVTASGLGGGANDEKDDALYTRLADRVQNPPQAGADHDYERWAKEVSGVTRAWVKGKQYGLGTVGVTFVLDEKEDIIPTAPDVPLVLEHIDKVRPITADVTVFAPSTQAVDFEIALNPNTVAVQNAVRAELESFFQRDAIPNAVTLKFSRMGEAISIGSGEDNHTLIAPAGNLSFPFGTLPVLGEITWSAA